jgi:hypothetical protein
MQQVNKNELSKGDRSICDQGNKKYWLEHD